MRNKAWLIFILFSSLLYAQPESQRWEKKNDPYLPIQEMEGRDYKFNSSSVTSFLVSTSISVYWFLISDQDGDNCPFYPSCSHFFIESVRETDLFRGVLMFGDRFTRDMNIINRERKYPIILHNRLYDPPELYSLENITFPPPLK